jgi:hypothetical protein
VVGASAQLDAWAKRLITAATLDDVLGDPAHGGVESVLAQRNPTAVLSFAGS